MTPAMQKALDLHQPGERKNGDSAYVGFEPVDAAAALKNRLRASLSDDDWPKKIRAFRDLFGLSRWDNSIFGPLSELREQLHRGLFAEEAGETLFPLDKERVKQLVHEARDKTMPPVEDQDEMLCQLAETVDGVLDTVVVGLGWLCELGLSAAEINQLMGEVHASNMTKVDNTGQPVYDTNGKVQKGENYVKADIAGLLREFVAKRQQGAN